QLSDRRHAVSAPGRRGSARAAAMSSLPGDRLAPVLAIGGLDPSGGAGILTDTATFAAFSAENVHGMAVVSALTAQSVDRCDAVFPVTVAELAAQLDTLARRHPPRAVKVGLLGDEHTARGVAQFL